ncbi:MAG: glutaredoxin family protein [Bacteroidetes bacterium]|nr:glutaredoxin family protein [Bacteroidota bacterium]
MAADRPQQEQEPGADVVVYSTTWCSDCTRAKRYLTSWGIAFREINIEEVEGAAEQVMTWAGGKRTVPTIVVGTTVLVNPGWRDLAAAVGREEV